MFRRRTHSMAGAMLLFGLLSVILLSAGGCKKDLSLSAGYLDFSTDTLVFDTVFTTIGTTTQQFKFYNKDTKPVEISEIRLMGGEDSPFRINVDGDQGTHFSNVSIEGRDSLFVFVEATLDVTGQALPMIVEDSIRFRTNGKDQYVHLVIWGQDAYFHYSNPAAGVFDLNEGVWPNDKPHVIYNYAFVDSAKALTIQQGTRVYLHKNSMLQVYKGALTISGTKDSPVTFEGDRLEAAYDDVSGQYYGIYFNKAQSSSITHLQLKNATAGIHVYSSDPANTAPALTLMKSRIENCARYGIFLYDGASLLAQNCIVAHNAFHSLLVLGGASFELNQCHLIGYSPENDQTPAVGISNYYVDGNTNVISSIPQGNLLNCVIYGNQDTEIVFDTLNANGAVSLNFQVRNCLIRKETPETNAIYANTLFNQDPQFRNIDEGDYMYWSTSPLHGAGNQSISSTPALQDILDFPRPALPDIGAYELD